MFISAYIRLHPFTSVYIPLHPVKSAYNLLNVFKMFTYIYTCFYKKRNVERGVYKGMKKYANTKEKEKNSMTESGFK